VPICAICGSISLGNQVFIELGDDGIELVAEELVHFAEAALGIEGGVFEVFALKTEGGSDVVADHLQPSGLGFIKRLAGILAENPVAVVAADGGVEGREGFIEAGGAADEGDEGSQLGERAGVFRQGIEAGVSFPDAERCEFGRVDLNGGEDFLDLGEGHFLAALGLLVVDREGGELILVLFQKGGEVGSHDVGVFAGISIPLGAKQDIERVVVDGLEIGGAGLDDEIDGGSGERLGGGCDEFLLGSLAGKGAGFGAFLLAVEFEGFFLNGIAVNGGEEVFDDGVERNATCLFCDLFLLLRGELALDAGEAAGERGDCVGIIGTHDNLHSKILEGDGGLGDERGASGFKRLGDADGIDDDVMGLGGLGRGAGLAQGIVIEGTSPPPFHLLKVALGFHIAHEEQAFERFHIGAGGDHVHGDGDARVEVVAEGDDGLGVFLVLVGDLFAEAVLLVEFLADDLDDVVGVGVGLGEDEGFRNFLTVGKERGQGVAEGPDHSADLGGADDVAVELFGAVFLVLVFLFPAFGTGELFAFLDETFEDGSAALGDFGFDEEDFVADVHAIGDGLLVGVFRDDVLFEEGEGAVVRGGGEADEEGVEVFDDLAPEVVDGAVAFIDDDEVEVLDGDFLVVGDGKGFLAARSGLGGVVLLVGGVEFLALEDGIHPLDGGDADLCILRHVGGLEALDGVELGELAVVVVRGESHELLLCLLAEVLGIDEEENALGACVFKQAVNGSDGSECFPGAGGHLDEGAGTGGFKGDFLFGDGIDLAVAQSFDLERGEIL